MRERPIMAGWISSKLKVAETFLQQIDQQAAESLGKNEIHKSDDDALNFKTPNAKTESSSSSSSSSSGVVVPLKDQFKKRATPTSTSTSTSTPTAETSHDDTGNTTHITPPLRNYQSKPPSSNPTTLTDTDWTELLSTPKQHQLSPSPVSGTKPLPLEVKKNHRNPANISKHTQKSLKTRVNGAATPNNKHITSDGEEIGSGNSPHVQLHSNNNGNDGHGENIQSTITTTSLEMPQLSGNVNGIIPDMKKQVGEEHSDDGFGRHEKLDAAASRRPSLSSDQRSTSDTDSTSSSSDSEKENQIKAERARKRERILAEKAAAKAVEAIKERENIVARLEGEKQSLEKILEERAKQQAQEASELQTSMIETMDAVDLEKQKHNNTRMEALARLTKLETANADLARLLATTQWNLEIEVNQVGKLRQQIESKDAVQEELRKEISKICQSGSSLNQLEASKGVEFEREILEAEYSFTCDKIEQLQDKAKKLEETIEMTRKEIEEPTEVELELKRRLGQLTDHLIQKQAQVESLSSEKATLLFRLEMVSRMLEEQKPIQRLSEKDLEMGTLGVSNSKVNPSFADKVRSGRQHFGSLIQQLDTVFSVGAAFVRKNSSAKFMSVVYLVCLHFWVVYILMSHSQVSDTKSGAVLSLESINKTTGTT